MTKRSLALFASPVSGHNVVPDWCMMPFSYSSKNFFPHTHEEKKHPKETVYDISKRDPLVI